MPLRIGIIGAGGVAAKHADAYRQNVECTVTAVSEVMVDRGRAFADTYGAPLYPDYPELLRSGLVDAVSICLPHHLHCEAATAAAGAGVNVLLEKPIGNTLQQADQIISACERARVKLMLGFVHRFRDEVAGAASLLHAGRAGTIATALDSICTLGGNHPPSWVWQRDSAGGGVLMYGGIHSLDRLRWLVGSEVEEVYAYQLNRFNRTNVEDGLAAVLHFESGAIATLFENSPAYGKPGGWITEIYGDQGAVRLATGKWLEFTSAAESFTRNSGGTDHFQLEIDEFVEAVLTDREPSITGPDGRKALAIAMAIYESAASHRPTRVTK